MTVSTLEQRVERLENDFMELSVYCRKQAVEHAYDAMQINWDKLDAMSDRLVRVEQVSEETRADVGVLKRQMGVVTIRLDRIDSEISRLDHNVEGLNDRVDGLTQRVDGLNDRVDGLTTRMDALSDRVDGLNERVDGLNDRVDGLTTRMDALSERVEGLGGQMDRMAASNAMMFETILKRLDDLSAQVRRN
ncbi:hypothetical protein [Microbispora sp. H11081]|uniref:hypothetical protein n=1 Tax=Microbispora sp. H11081 TaxID=2729107 RepID=UPI001472B1EF|nr:hypothetical protein [Microbispora sp. H11081]